MIPDAELRPEKNFRNMAMNGTIKPLRDRNLLRGRVTIVLLGGVGMLAMAVTTSVFFRSVSPNLQHPFLY